jgi:hypothetical protein
VLRFAFFPVLALTLAAAACGGDDDSGDSSPTESGSPASATAAADEIAYFESLEPVMQDFATEAAELNDALNRAFDPAKSVEERQQDGIAYAADFEAFTVSRRDAIAAIEAPASLSAQHAGLVAAAEEAVVLAQSVRESVTAMPVADTTAYVNVVASFNGVNVNQHYRDACVELQRSATAPGIEVDLACN